MRLKQAISVLLIALCGGMAGNRVGAQQMLLSSLRTSGGINDPITFDIVSRGNTGLAVSWGTTVALSDPINMTYVPDYDGQGHPYRQLEPFFDNDFSDVSQVTNGRLNLDFVNFTPDANFGFNGEAKLAEFQVLLGTGTPINADLTVTLSALGIPPNGTAMQDDVGNNILQPTDLAHPTDNVSTAHLYVTGFGPNLRWFLGTPPQNVPEPSIWLVGAASLTMGIGFLRRRRCA